MANSIDFNGKNSYRDFRLKISEATIGNPSKIKRQERVPFSNDLYDFSEIYGGQEYEERPLSFTFYIDNYENINSFYIYETEILNWLVSQNSKQILKYSQLPGYYFLAEVVDSTETDFKLVGGTATIEFSAYPFKISELKEGHDIWDEFNFLLDYAQITEFEVKGSKDVTLFNNGASIINPEIEATSEMEIIMNDGTYNVPSGRSKSSEFMLPSLENKMTIKGNGTISFHFRKELV